MRCRRWILVGLVLFILESADAAPARASSLLTYVFQGTIKSIDNPLDEFATDFKAGDPFTLRVSMPTDAPNLLGQGDTGLGVYSIAPQDLSLTLNGHPFPGASLQPTVANGSPFGTSGSVFLSPSTGGFGGSELLTGPGPTLNWLGVNFYLQANTGKLASYALPTSLNLSDFAGGEHQYVYNGTPAPYLLLSGHFADAGSPADLQSYSNATGIITSATVSVQPVPIPEPGTFLVVALGAAWYHRRRRA